MQITGKYLKVWKVKTSNTGHPILDLGDSEKQRDGTYKNWTWFGCLCVGKAKDIQVGEKDTIEILSGKISMDEYNGKWNPKVIIFEMNVTNRASAPQGQNNYQSQNSAEFEDDIPF